MKPYIIFILLLFVICIGYAQEPMFERQVPQAIKKNFVEKYPEVTTVEWFKINDTVIEAQFMASRKKSFVEFSTEGIFLSSSSEMAPKETPGMISNYVRGEHPNEVVNLAMMREDAAGKITYYIEVKRPGVNQPTTKLYFDFYGNITKIIKPEEAKLEKDAEDGFGDDFDSMSAGEPIKKKELPSKITKYIDKTYKDYKFDQAIFINDDTHGNIYQVKLRRLGYKEFLFVHFDLLGDFLDINQK